MAAISRPIGIMGEITFEDNKFSYQPQFGIKIAIEHSTIKEWWFDIQMSDVELSGAESMLPMINIMRAPADPFRKISLVYLNESAFEAFIRCKEKIPYRGELSAILMDSESKTILKEEYVAHYEQGDTSGEFIII